MAHRPPFSEAGHSNPQPALADFLAELLDEQQRLQTPVATFARAHDRLSPSALQSVRPSLIPLSAPGPGEQYAFEVDLDACTGCKACVAACHSLNGLDDSETWRDVGLIVSPAPAAYAQTVTTACHHCTEPGCLHGCPVRAYEKDPATGIVRHLDDQCIGCSYCILKCPYDVPKYNDRLGIVRKCDLCHGRLAAGEAPACAQACPTQAIRIVTVETAAPNPAFLSAAPDPRWTGPTTRYRARRPVPATARPADERAVRPEPAHTPLVLMLVGTQASVGALLAGLVPLALGLALAGLTASVFHLGQPFRAWRAFLGLRRSWLSREILVFGLYPVLLGAAGWPAFSAWAVPAVVATGLAGIGCSIMIYVDTPRREWRLARTLPNFVGTTAVTGLALAFAAGSGTSELLALALAATTVVHRLADGVIARGERMRHLRRGPLRRTAVTRDLLLAAGGLVFPALTLIAPNSAFGCAVLGSVAVLGAELAGRAWYFQSVSPSKMPGVSPA